MGLEHGLVELLHNLDKPLLVGIEIPFLLEGLQLGPFALGQLDIFFLVHGSNFLMVIVN